MSLDFDINNINTEIDKLAFYQIYINDTYNAKIVGRSNGYCIDDCQVSDFRSNYINLKNIIQNNVV